MKKYTTTIATAFLIGATFMFLGAGIEIYLHNLKLEKELDDMVQNNKRSIKELKEMKAELDRMGK